MLKKSRLTALTLIPLLLLLLGAAVWMLGRPGASSAPAEPSSSAAPMSADLQKATFAGGCFWCVESALQDLEGVQSAVSGFSGGTKPDPTYEEGSSGQSVYAEAVQVTYDPEQISYERLLRAYWRDIDPTDGGGQFADRGSQYRPVIFYHNERQKRLAQQSKKDVAQSGVFDEPIAVKIEPFERFYAAKEYHQDYYEKHPERYKRYFEGSGRAPFLRRVWKSHPVWGDESEEAASSSTMTGGSSTSSGSVTEASASMSSNNDGPKDWEHFEKPSQEELKEQLSPMQYKVTQQDGTEPAFQNKYYDNKRAGIYVDVVSGEPLFSSKEKFDSGTGWPSFYKPLEPELIVEEEDRSLGMVRTEVRSRHADSHLGHVFEWSGEPEVPTDLRYCINSAALKFIPADRLEEEGYGEYASLFE